MGEKNKVVLGLSGGVDSAVAAAMLSQDLEVHCLYLDTGTGDAGEAAALADAIELPFSTVDVRGQLEQQVCAPFAADYLAGRTPLPCARCNRLVKFPALLAEAERVGAHWVATGHYARTANGALFRGRPANDQSYLLARLPTEVLQRVIFPLGYYEKAQVRTLAAAMGLSVADKPDSMEICFVPHDDYAAWLEARGPVPPPGDFVDREGRVLGRHKGIHHYTLGQRRGLGVPAAHRLVVSAIDPEKNQVVLSDGGDLWAGRVRCVRPNWIALPGLDGPLDAQARFRHSRACAGVTVEPLDGGGLLVRCHEPVRAPTPGQLAVFYDGDVVLGSAWIEGAGAAGSLEELGVRNQSGE